MSLPSGYKRLEYIQSTGKQYINTVFKPNNNSRVILDFEPTAAYSNIVGIFGIRDESSATASNMFVFWNNGANTFRTDYFGTQKTMTVSTLLARKTVDKDKNVTTIGSVSASNTASTGQCSKNLYLFCVNNAGNANYFAKLKLYSCQIYDNGTIVRDFIPCQTTSGEVGLWDDVNSVFYGNAGTGTFTAGPVIAIAADKSEITKLAYIQSRGTQYVDAGFKPTGATKVVIDFQMVSQGSSQQGVFGSRPGTSGRFTVFTGNGIADLQVDYNNEQTLASVGSSITGLNVNSRTTLEVSNSLVINGTTVKTVSAASFASTYNLFLFANNNSGTAQLPGTMKLYSCQIYDNGTIVRDFIPCQTTDGEIGLWDDVNRVFYGNAGTGTFTAGPVLIPDAPSDLTSSVDDGTVTLSWPAVSGATGYKISRDGVLIYTQTGLTYTETVTKGQTYTYSVVAYNDYGDSDPATLSVNVPLVPPSTPSNFAASVSGLSATLSWDAPAKATGYRLYRDGVLLSDQTDTVYIDAVEPFVSYVYTLIAYNDDGESGQATVSVLVIIPPAAPQNFMVLYAGMKEISLSWSAVTGADSYELKRGGTTVYTGSDTAYTDSHLQPETGYTYSLTAINTAGTSLEVTLETATTGLVLITDRTAADVNAGNDNGTYKASDLNRVGAAMNYVAARLREQGYDPHISPKTDLKDDDWVTPAAQAVYLGDLAELRKQFTMLESTPRVPPRILATAINSGDGLTYGWANDIEQILVDIDDTLTRLQTSMFYSAELYSGEV